MNKFNEADKIGQEKILPTLKYLFRKCNLNIDQHIDDCGHIDIYFTATTKNGTEYYYAVECKHRRMPHTRYDNYILEKNKEKYLMEDSKYKPLYLNSFDDGWIIIWDLSKNNQIEKLGEKVYNKYTVVESEKYVENKNALKVSDAVCVTKMI